MAWRKEEGFTFPVLNLLGIGLVTVRVNQLRTFPRHQTAQHEVSIFANNLNQL